MIGLSLFGVARESTVHTILPAADDGEREATRNCTERGEAGDMMTQAPSVAWQRVKTEEVVVSTTTKKSFDAHVTASVSVVDGGVGRITCRAADTTGHATTARAAPSICNGDRTEIEGLEQPSR